MTLLYQNYFHCQRVCCDLDLTPLHKTDLGSYFTKQHMKVDAV